MKTYQVNQEGFYGDFGGAYIPEILHRCVEELRNAYRKVLADEGFQKEYDALLKDYVGRPSPLYLAPRLSEKIRMQDLPETGGPEPYGSAQNQQRHRTGASGPENG